MTLGVFQITSHKQNLTHFHVSPIISFYLTTTTKKINFSYQYRGERPLFSSILEKNSLLCLWFSSLRGSLVIKIDHE